MGLVLSLLMACGIALTFGAILAWRRAYRRQSVLMALAATTMFANVAIWAVPDHTGRSPLTDRLK